MSRRAFVFVSMVCLVMLPAARASDLRELNSRHYRVHTDLEPSLARDLSARMDQMYDEYAQRLAIFSGGAPVPRLEVYLFSRQRDYTTFTGGRLRNSGGVFLPGQNLLAAFLDGQGRDTLRRTLQHEAFHQFAYNAISPDLPIWLNEGLAQLFEEGLWNGDGFLLGEVPPRRVRQLQADLDSRQLLPFNRLLKMTPAAWADRLAAGPAQGTAQYNQSWAMVHFLVVSPNDSGGFRYRSRLLDMLRLLHQGKSSPQAFESAFGSNIQGFQDRFIEYARSLKPTPEATLIEDQGVIADLLIDLAKDGRHFDDIEAFRKFVTRGRYRLHYSRGNLEWDTDRDTNRYFADLTGRRFAADELFFWPRTGAPLPDVICRCTGSIALRTRFYDAPGGGVEHELLIEPARSFVASN